MAAQGFYKAVGYVILAVLARSLSKETFGQFFYAAALAGLWIQIADLGTYSFLIREVSSRPEQKRHAFAQVLSLRLPLVALYMLMVSCMALVLKRDIFLIVVLTAFYMGFRELYQTAAALFMGMRRIRLSVIAFGSSQVLLLILIFWLASRGANIYQVLGAYLASYAYLAVIGAFLVHRAIGRPSLTMNLQTLIPVVRRSLPFSLLALLQLAHFRIDTLMLGALRPYTEVADYEAAVKLLAAAQFVIYPFSSVFFPICSRLAATADWPGLEKLYKRLLNRALAAGVAVAAAVLVLAGIALPFVYGEDYADAVPLLRVLYVTVPSLYAGAVSVFVINAMHLERRGVTVMAVGLGANVALNAALIPAFGALGAAWTTVVTQTLTAGLLWMHSRAVLRRRSASASVRGESDAKS